VENTLRGALPAEDPEVLRFLGGVGWRLEQRLTPARARLTADEARRTFGVTARTAGAIVRESQDLALQARMEELVIPRMTREELDAVVEVDGACSPPCILLFPHAGNLLLLTAALARRWPGLVVFRAPGLPPASAQARGPLRASWFNRRIAARRVDDEARLPIRWESDAASLPGWLADGHLVAAAFDDRAWPTYVRTPFLGREALLSPDPFTIARAAGVPVVPVTIRRARDKSSRVAIGKPIAPELPALLAVIEPFLRAHPGHYARWLVDCHLRADLDDHPLFTDWAPDDRWRKWPVLS
jgi:lauroyl/myristoyl acyltransferase